MRTLRYLLVLIAITGAISVSATATQYGNTYQPKYDQSQYNPGGSYTQMPSINMQSTSVLQGSGSALPQAAVTGSYTAEEAQSASMKSGPRRGRPGDWTDPYKDPLGDAIIPLTLIAFAYVCVCALHKKRA